MQIGDRELQTQGFVKGNYPIWNHYKWIEVRLGEELTFEPDMRVSIVTKPVDDAWGSTPKPPIVGEFSVPLNSLLKRSKKPQFFNLINEEG